MIAAAGCALLALPMLLRSTERGNTADSAAATGETVTYVAMSARTSATHSANGPPPNSRPASTTQTNAGAAETRPLPTALPASTSSRLSGDSICRVKPARSTAN